jgi:hypothetical protein
LLAHISAYTAGVFDGEGNIHLGAVPHSGYRLQVQLTNSFRPLLVWLKEQWGGGIYIAARRKGWSQTWNLSWSNRTDQRRLLDAMRPYLIVKRQAADIALRFLELRAPGPGRKASPAILERRHELFLELRGLPRSAYQPASSLFEQLEADLG